MASKRSSRSHTKSGPGRYHGQGAMFITPDGERVVRKSKRRFPVALQGGNWQGMSYISYAQHDAIKRTYIEARTACAS